MISRRDALKLSAAGLMGPAASIQCVSSGTRAHGSTNPRNGTNLRTQLLESDSSRPIGPDYGRSVAIKWHRDLDDFFQCHIFDDVVILSSADGTLTSMSARTGVPNWQYDTGESFIVPLSRDGDQILVKSLTYVQSLNILNGAPLWRYYLAGDNYFTDFLVVSDVVLAVGQQTLFAIALSSGQELWRLNNLGWMTLSQITDQLLFIFTETGGVAVHLATGQVTWEAEEKWGRPYWINEGMIGFSGLAGNNSYQSHQINGVTGTESWSAPGYFVLRGQQAGLVCVQTENHLGALDVQTGSEVWRFDTRNTDYAIFQGPGQKIYLTQSAVLTTTICLDSVTGQELWRTDAGSVDYSGQGVWGSPDYVILEGEHVLIAVDAETGREINRISLADWELLYFSDTTLYVWQTMGPIRAFDVTTGKELWNLDAGPHDFGPSGSWLRILNESIYIKNTSSFYALGNLKDMVLQRAVILRGAPSSSGVERGKVIAGSKIDHDDIKTTEIRSDGAWIEVEIGDVSGWIPLDAIDPVTLPPEGEIEYVYNPASNAGSDTTTAVAGTVYDVSGIRATLPTLESMPGPFTQGGDTPQSLVQVTEALGGTKEVQDMLATTGWQAAMTRTFVSADPSTTGTTVINVSTTAFKNDTSARRALPHYATILEGYGWVPVQGEPLGDDSRMLVWTNPDSGEAAVTIYFVDSLLLYRVFAIGPSGFDSMPNAVYVVQQILA